MNFMGGFFSLQFEGVAVLTYRNPTMAATKSVSLAEQVSARTAATRETARREWSALCRAAVSGDNPTIEVVEDLARALGLPSSEAADAFDGDVAALREHPQHLAAADQMAAEVRELIQPFTNHDGLAVAIVEAQERLDELKRIEIRLHYATLGAGEAATRARYVAQRHPRVLNAEVAR